MSGFDLAVPPGHAAAAPAGSHRNNFNALRLLLASLVLVSHAPELVDGNRGRELLTRLFGTLTFGELAVDGFFLLSGYLVMQSWILEPHPGRFLRKRALRIVPGFAVASLLSALVAGSLLFYPGPYLSCFPYADYFRGLAILQAPAGPAMYAGSRFVHPNGSMWTIQYEFSCYLMVMALGAVGLLRWRVGWLLWMLALAVAYAWVVARGSLHPHYLYFEGVPLGPAKWKLMMNGHVPRFALCFAVGGLYFLFRDRIPRRGELALACLAVLLVALFHIRWAEPALMVCGGYLLFHVAFADWPPLYRFRALPDVSYGIYLYGYPVQLLLIRFIPGVSPWLLLPLSVAACVPLALFSWYGVEKPCLRLKGGRRAPAQIVGGGADNLPPGTGVLD